MATANCGVFEEHLGVIAALKENFLRREDAISVAQTNSLREEVAQLCRARESEVKDAIKELTARVDVAEKRATYPAPEDAHRQRVEALQTATQQAHQGVDGLNAQLRQLETTRAEVKAELEALQEKEKYLEELIDKVEPAIRHKLSLYAHISKIVWDYESPNTIAGIMDDPRRSILKSFDLGTDVNFESVNKLWHIIDGDE